MYMRVALVHDFLNQFGGAERVLLALSEIFPKAPIYTLLYDSKKVPQFAAKQVYTSDLQKLPNFIKKRHQLLLPFYPSAVEKFDFSDYDLVISSSGAFSKNIITSSNTRHICYCHSPMRYVWDYSHEYLREKIKSCSWESKCFLASKIKTEKIGKVKGLATRIILNWLRIWDWSGKDRVDLFLANSKHTASRIKKYYHKDSEVVYPPVSIPCKDELKAMSSRKFFLCVGRLSAYKKIDLVVKAFNDLRLPLVIVGEGSERARLEKLNTSPLTIFTGSVTDEYLAEYYSWARALIFPNEEDFGIVPVEAMMHGTPVIAYGKGGVLESVISLKTGIFFDEQTPEGLSAAVKKFMVVENLFDEHFIAEHARQFSKDIFKGKIISIIEKMFEENEK